MKKRTPKIGSISYYIKEVARYSSKRKTDDRPDDGYPPVVPELLLSLLIEVRSLFGACRILVGLLIVLALKLIFKIG